MIRKAFRGLLAVGSMALAIWQVHLLLVVLHGRAEASNVDTAPVENGPFIVGITREGQVASADVMTVRAPRIRMGDLTLTWVIDDGSDVKEGDLVAKIDVSEYKFQVEQQRLEHQKAVSRIEQERRDRGRDHETAETRVVKQNRALDMLRRSQGTETEQGTAQVGFDRWNLTWAETDLEKQIRLWSDGIVPETTKDHSERTVRSREYGLRKSEEDLRYLSAEHGSEQAQSQRDVDVAEFEAELAERRIGEAVQSAEERASMSEERLRDMEKELADSELRAPKAGVVVLGKTWDMGRRALREGDHVWGRMRLCDITSLKDLEVRLRVDEASVGNVRVGQEVIVTVEGAADREFAGEVSVIGAVAHELHPFEDPNAIPGQRVFDVIVKLADPDPEVLRPGVTAKAQFVFERLPKAVYVPVAAVFDRPDGEVVYVQQRNRFVARRVETGERNDEAVVVLSGVKAGERVALSDPARPERQG